MDAVPASVKWAETCGENKNSFYRLDNWYPVLKDYTFKTISTQLTFAEAKAIKKFREHSKALVTIDVLRRSEHDPYFKRNSLYSPEYFDKIESQVVLTPEERATLAALEQRIQDLIASFTTGKVFSKLSTRSPKDAGVWTQRMETILFDQLRLLHDPPKPDHLSHAFDYIAFTRAAQYSLAVTSGKEVLQLWVRSNRICEDLTFAELSAGEKMDLRIEIREWCPEIFPEREFRLFVWNKRLVAISQYYNHVFVPDIYENRDLVKQKIEEFYNKELAEKIPNDVEHLTVDLAISQDFSKIWLIEVGNPPPVAGTGMFDWDDEEDHNVLTGQRDGVDFRVLDKFEDEVWGEMWGHHLVLKFHEKPVSFTPLLAVGALLVAVGVGYWFTHKNK